MLLLHYQFIFFFKKGRGLGFPVSVTVIASYWEKETERGGVLKSVMLMHYVSGV